MFTPKSSCRLSPRRWAAPFAPLEVTRLTHRLLEMQVILSFLHSILCCSPKPPWTPARTGRRLQRFSSRPSTFLPSSSPCRLSLACKYARQKPLTVWFLGVGISRISRMHGKLNIVPDLLQHLISSLTFNQTETCRDNSCRDRRQMLIMRLTDLSTPAGTPQVAPPVSCLIRATA